MPPRSDLSSSAPQFPLLLTFFWVFPSLKDELFLLRPPLIYHLNGGMKLLVDGGTSDASVLSPGGCRLVVETFPNPAGRFLFSCF